ncbi:hypothetical protein SAMN04488574_1872 [Bacillus sp. 71mf]|nr:hypothetical protein SAMN04488574_1872 [Bacillus sp. 71mf]SFS97244.1 hypothetical protein SAMN04488145_10635 [Bacillus sp. 103mf]
MIEGEEDGKFVEDQYTAYQSLMQNWEDLQPSLLQSILEYYKQERYELGYDIEVNENYPLVETTDQILEMISLDGIVVSYAGIFEGQDIGITFNCTWDMENGLGLRLLNEKVTEVGYQDKDIAILIYISKLKKRHKKLFLFGEDKSIWPCIEAVMAFSCHAQSFKIKKGSKV